MHGIPPPPLPLQRKKSAARTRGPPAQVSPEPPPNVVVRLLLLADGIEGQSLHRQGLPMCGELLEDSLGCLQTLLVVLALVEFLPQNASFGWGGAYHWLASTGQIQVMSFREN